MFCLSSINEEPPQAQQNGEDHEGPSPKRAKDFFSSLKRLKDQIRPRQKCILKIQVTLLRNLIAIQQ